MIENIRGLMLFEEFSEEQLQWVTEHSTEATYEAGAQIFTEGQPSEALWTLIAGEWRLSRLVGAFDTTVITTSQPGTWAGGLPLMDGTYQISTRATKPSRFLRIPNEALQHMLSHGFPLARHIIAGLTTGARRSEALKSQHEKLTALGKLSAGLAHEINNPAAAARRAAAQLRRTLGDQREVMLGFAPPDVAAHWATELDRLQEALVVAAAAAQPLGPLQRSDREETVAAWLDERQVPDSYDAASTLVDVGLTVEWLEDLAVHTPAPQLPTVLRWVVVAATGQLLSEQLEHSIGRIAELVAAVKSYSFMDQAPLQEVDLHEGLESTLTMLGSKLKGGVTVIRDYDLSLPRVTAYGSELNQVWTNLIDNAIDAMHGQGQLIIRSACEGDNVLVEIIDSGSGIPPDVLPHIFEPFFTTKGVGEGTGLGLEIAYRIVGEQHHGSITVSSEPGTTCFKILLPIHPPERKEDRPLLQE